MSPKKTPSLVSRDFESEIESEYFVSNYFEIHDVLLDVEKTILPTNHDTLPPLIISICTKTTFMSRS